MSKVLKKLSFADIIILFALIFNAGFNEYVSCVITIFTTAYLFYRIIKNKAIQFNLNLFTISIFLISITYGLTAIWAIDSGMAFIGFLKFLPLSLYLLVLQQNIKVHILNVLPLFAAVLTVVSLVGMCIGFTKDFFSVAGRLAGFFQYPNTFALFLLVCELLIITKEKLKILDYLYLIILIAGLLYTGSRMIFVIALCANLVILILKIKDSKNKRYYLIAFLILSLTAIVVLIFNKDILNRYMSISVLESTFIGRILYWFDALPLLIKYPFGMGYLGYSYIQTDIQTGVYTVQYIHNDFLQLLLDIGWIPTIFFSIAIIHILFKRKIPFSKKIIISSICVHSFFDFNLQFIAIFMLLIVLCNDEKGKVIVVDKKLWSICGVLILILLTSIYMGVHLLLSAFYKQDIAQKMYPYNTENMISILENATDLQIANDIADKIIEQNEFTYIPYSVKSKYYFSVGDINNFIDYKHIAFEKNPFNYEEYEEYCSMLISCISKYNTMGDKTSKDFCINELIEAKERLEGNEELLSTLGTKIKDQPKTRLSDDLLYYINRFSEE